MCCVVPSGFVLEVTKVGEFGCEVQLVAAVEEGGDVGAVVVVNDRSRGGREGGSKVVGRGEFLVTFC